MIHSSDFVTIALLVALEGLLSADNAMVLAVLVLGLPQGKRDNALRYGIVGAFGFRTVAVLLASRLINLWWVKLLGAGYLLYLVFGHFHGASVEERRAVPPASPWLGLSAFWATVVKVELTDLVFAIDSILVAVAMTTKLWVVITGGILGIAMMRLVIGKLLAIVERYPPLVDGAFVIIAWVGTKLLLEFLHTIGYIAFVIPQWFSLGLIVVIFGAALLYAVIAEKESQALSDVLRVLIVDSVVEHAEMIVTFLRASDAWPAIDVRQAESYDAALRAFDVSTFDIAFFDYRLGPHDGLALLREIRERGVETPVVILTSHGAEDVAVEAMKTGAADYLGTGSLSVEGLERAIRHALALHGKERQRRQAEAALRASEERFRALAENNFDALILLDAEGRITYMTPSSERQVGWRPDDMVGRSIFEFIHPDDVGAVAGRMSETLERPGLAVTQEVRFRHADGGWRVMEGVGVNRLAEPSVGAIVVNARDITDRRRLEEQLRQAQKMEAVGQLAGGVAHDFNNLLTAILGYCNLMLDEVPNEDPMHADLEEIQSAGERAAALTRQLLAFSRRQMLQPQVVDLNALVRHLEKLLRRLISEDVALVTTLGADVRAVLVDPASIEQVLVNLAVNARDAMPLGGQLTIETANVDADETHAGSHMAMPPGPYVMLAVGDTGHGMDEATRTRIFEPFFTTKEQGKGTGLGLATVYGIVKQSGGYIWVYSEPNAGSVFKVYLPPVEGTRSGDGVGSERLGQKAVGWETVLLVEDDDGVRAIAREVLRRQGYVVVEARNGVDALRVAEQRSGPIHVLVTDVVMPHMSGRDLAERLGSSRPTLKLLFMSGHTDHALTHHELTRGSAFLHKPFTPEVFARAVRRLLDV